MTPAFQLCYTNPYGEKFYLAELGDAWPHEPSRRLVSRTVRTPQEAMQFATVPEAVAVLVQTIKEPPGWEVVSGVKDADIKGSHAEDGAKHAP